MQHLFTAELAKVAYQPACNSWVDYSVFKEFYGRSSAYAESSCPLHVFCDLIGREWPIEIGFRVCFDFLVTTYTLSQKINIFGIVIEFLILKFVEEFGRHALDSSITQFVVNLRKKIQKILWILTNMK